jgi:hypothetical protein
MFFSEEKNQKTLILSAAPAIEAMAGIFSQAPEIKVFCFFSSEKKDFFNLMINFGVRPPTTEAPGGFVGAVAERGEGWRV